MIHTIIFKREHLDLIEPLGGPQDLVHVSAAFKDVDRNEAMLAFSIMDEEKVVAIFGIFKLWEGVGEVFTVMCKDIKQYGRALYEHTIRNIPTVFKALDLWRIQATVITRFAPGIKFIEGVGLTREGIMRKWSPLGDDVYMYSILREE